MTNVNKFKKLLIASSSLAMLSSMDAMGAAPVAVSNANNWQLLNGKNHALNNNDDVQVTNSDLKIDYRGELFKFQTFIFDQNYNPLNFNVPFTVDHNHNAVSKVGNIILAQNVIVEHNALKGSKSQVVDLGDLDINGQNNTVINLTRINLSHKNIVDNTNNGKKVEINFYPYNYYDHTHSYINESSKLTLKGSNLSGLGNIYFGNDHTKINAPQGKLTQQQQNWYKAYHTTSCDGEVTFDTNAPATYNGYIYSGGEISNDKLGQLVIKKDVTFTQKVGYNPHLNNGKGDIAEISRISVQGNANLTTKNDIYTDKNAGIWIDDNASLTLNSTNNPIILQAPINRLYTGDDNEGTLNVQGNNNITIKSAVGDDDYRLKLINIKDGKSVAFESEVYAKKIEVAKNNVTFEDKVDMFTRGQQNKITDRGALEFKDAGNVYLENDFSGDITTSKNSQGIIHIKENLKLEGNTVGKALKIKGIAIHDDKALTLTGNDLQFAIGIQTNKANQGVINIAGDVKIGGTIGAINAKNGDIKLKEIDFKGDHTLRIDGKYHLSNGIKTSAKNQGTLILSDDNKTLNGRVVSTANNLKSLQFSAAKADITVANADIGANDLKLLGAQQKLTINKGVNPDFSISGKGNLEFAGNSTAKKQIGSNAERLKEITTAAQNVTFDKAVYADKLNIAGKVKFNDGTLGTNNLVLGKNAEVIFERQLTAAAKITAAAQNSGKVVFKAGGEIGAIGAAAQPVGRVRFEGATAYNLHGDIYAQNLNLDQGVTLNTANNNIKIVVSNANIDNIPANWTNNNGTLTVVAKAAPVLNNAPAQARGAQVAAQPQQAKAAQPQQERVEQPQPRAQIRPIHQGENQELILQLVELSNQFSKNVAPLIARGNSAFMQELSQPQRLSTESKQKVQKVEQIIAAPSMNRNINNIEETVKKFETEIGGAKLNKTETAKIAQDDNIVTKSHLQQALAYVVDMAAHSKEERETTTRNTQQAAKTSRVVSQVLDNVNTALNSRIGEMNAPLAEGVGAGAGDDFSPRLNGAWVKGLYGVSKQKNDGDVAGYNGNSAGATIGADAEIFEDNVMGVAYSHADSKFKYKASRSGDKVEAQSHIISIYDRHDFDENLSVNAIVSAGTSNVKSKRIAIDDKVASAKIKNKSISAESSVSYKVKADNNLYFIPSVGAKYSYYRDGAYTESGAGVYNMSVDKKSNKTLAAIAGVNVMMPYKATDDLTLVPSVNASVEGNVLNKKQDVQAKLVWMDDYFENDGAKGNKAEKVKYNVGGGLLAKHGNLELSANYNLHMHKKFQSHQGALKLRVNF